MDKIKMGSIHKLHYVAANQSIIKRVAPNPQKTFVQRLVQKTLLFAAFYCLFLLS